MAVADVEVGNFIKLFLEPLRIFDRASPKNVADTIITCNISVRLALGNLIYPSRDGFLIFSESQEHGASVCVLDISQFSTVFFFFGEGVLMLLDAVLFVVLDAG